MSGGAEPIAAAPLMPLSPNDFAAKMSLDWVWALIRSSGS